MKLSNNALNFLLAQYRAIFKRAYVKGLAAAVLLTAGLAAGAAQAADFTWTNGSGDIVVISGTNNTITIEDGSKDQANNLSVAADTALTISGTTTGSGATFELNGDAKINGTLTLSGTYIQGYKYGNDSSGTLTVSGQDADLTLDKSHIEISKTTITDGAEITIGGVVNSKEQVEWRGNSNLFAGWEDSGSESFVALTIDGGATVNLNNDSIIGVAYNAGNAEVAHIANVGDATINFAGDDRLGALFLGMTDGNGNKGAKNVINLNDGAKLLVADDKKFGAVFAPTVNINAGAEINVGSGATFEVAGSLKDNGSTNTGTVNFAGTITNNGTFNVGNNSGTTTFTATDGIINNNGTLNFYGDADLSGVAVTNTKAINVSGDLTVDQVSNLYSNDTTSGATLTLNGNLTVTEETSFDITQAGLTNTKDGSTLTAENSTVTVDNNYDDKFNTLVVDTLAAQTSGNEIFTIAAGTNVTVLGGMTVENQPATETVSAKALADTSGYENVNVSGALTLGDETSSSKILDINYNVSGAGSLSVGGGDWKVGDVTINSSEGLNVKAGSLDTNKLTVTSGDANITAGTLTVEELTVASDGSVKLGGTEESVLKINGIGETGMKGTISGGNLSTITLSEAAIKAITKQDGADAGDIDTSKWSSDKVSLAAGSKLTLDLGTKPFKDANEAKSYIDSLVSSSKNNGLTDIGDATIESLKEKLEDKFVTTSEISDLANITSNALKKTTLVVETNTTVSGGEWKGLATSGDSVSVQGTTILNAADNGYFAYQYTGTDLKTASDAANITVSGDSSVLTLVGSGQAGNISGTPNNSSNDDILNFITDDSGNGEATVGTITSFKEVNVNSTVNATSISSVRYLNVNGKLNVTEQDGSGGTVAAVNLNVAGTLTADSLTFGQGSSGAGTSGIVSGLVDVGSLTIRGTTNTTKNSLNIVDGGTVLADTINAGSGSNIYVGTEGDGDESLGSAGFLEVGELNLSGSSLIVDPDYGTQASLVAVLGGVTDSGDRVAADVDINGSALIGQNSIVGFGVTLAELQAATSKYVGANGSLDKDTIGAIAYFNENYTIANGESLVIDSTKTGSELEQANSSSSGNAFTLGANSAVIISDSLTDGLINNLSSAVITFEGSASGSDITAAESSQVIFDSTEILGNDQVQLFSGTSAISGITDTTFAADISAANGLLSGTIDSDGTVTFKLIDAKQAAAKLYHQSSPVKALTLAVMGNEGSEYDANDPGVGYIAEVNAYNGGAAIEQTSRLAVYGGAVQATLMAQQSSTDAVADRLGMANPNSALVSSSNAQGGGLWLAPVYKNHDSDGFDAQGVDYGADIDLYGVALGADFTTASGVRAGAYFNVGSGEADGQGVASAVTNDFDYFGLGLYAGMTFGNFSLIADAGFTQASNDIEQAVHYHDIGTVKADTDTQAVSVGLRGEYLFATPWVDVVPHVGMRYTNLDMDSYDAVVNGYTVATTDADNMQVFSIPFGVTFSKDIALGDWSVKPVFDITLTANAGDTEMDADTTFIGASNLALSTEVMDDFTYGTSLGIDAKFKEAFSFGLNVGYTGSSNADEFGVNANARYTF